MQTPAKNNERPGITGKPRLRLRNLILRLELVQNSRAYGERLVFERSATGPHHHVQRTSCCETSPKSEGRVVHDKIRAPLARDR